MVLSTITSFYKLYFCPNYNPSYSSFWPIYTSNLIYAQRCNACIVKVIVATDYIMSSNKRSMSILTSNPSFPDDISSYAWPAARSTKTSHRNNDISATASLYHAPYTHALSGSDSTQIYARTQNKERRLFDLLGHEVSWHELFRNAGWEIMKRWMA